jgi:hypothetical protein
LLISAERDANVIAIIQKMMVRKKAYICFLLKSLNDPFGAVGAGEDVLAQIILERLRSIGARNSASRNIIRNTVKKATIIMTTTTMSSINGGMAGLLFLALLDHLFVLYSYYLIFYSNKVYVGFQT